MVLGHGAAGAEFFNLFFARVGMLRDIGIASFGCCSGVLDVDEIKLFVFGLRCAVCDFWREDRDGGVRVMAEVLFTSERRPAFGFGIFVASSRREFGSRRCCTGDLGRAARSFLAGFGEGGRLGRYSGCRFRWLFGRSFGLRKLDFL